MYSKTDLLKNQLIQCPKCALNDENHKSTPGNGITTTRLMLVGEAPGISEIKQRAPFVGLSGKLLDKLLFDNGLSRAQFYTTNIVKCRTPNNRDPEQSEITACEHWLTKEINAINPRVIVSLGRTATRYFTKSNFLTMEFMHGIPYRLDDNTTLFPVYHPAAGLHNAEMLQSLIDDFKALGEFINSGVGTVRALTPTDYGFNPVYIELRDSALLPDPELDNTEFLKGTYIAIDTESADNTPWCISFSRNEFSAYMIKADQPKSLSLINELVTQSHITTILHNAMYDLPILHSLEIYPRSIIDTMSASYLLQNLPQGLKPLAYRLINLSMSKYSDVVEPSAIKRAINYICHAASITWPDPDPQLIHDPRKGFRIKQSQNIGKKLKRLINNTPPELWRSKFKAMDGRQQVIDELGPMPEGSLEDVAPEIALHYACEDALATFRIWPVLQNLLDRAGLLNAFYRDMAMLPMVVDMKKSGMPVDKTVLREFKSKYSLERERIASRVSTINKGIFVNLASPKQVIEFLASRDIRVPSSDKATIEARPEPECKLITEYRKYNTIINNFINPLLEKSVDNRIHAEFKITRTDTGRLAVSNPPLMGIPKRSKEGRELRRAFKAGKNNLLLAADYSQIELRVTAHYSNDKTMLSAFNNDQDIHALTASKVFGVPIDQLDPYQHRAPAKIVNFGIIYQMSARGLQIRLSQEGLDWTESDCANFMTEYFKLYPGVKNWIEGIKSFVRRHGYVLDLFGRRRLIPEVRAIKQSVINAGLRQAVNAPVQMGAQSIIKQAMGLIDYASYNARPLLQIHDDILYEIEQSRVDDFIDYLIPLMETCVKLRVPIRVDPETGADWYDMKEYNYNRKPL